MKNCITCSSIKGKSDCLVAMTGGMTVGATVGMIVGQVI